MNYSRIEVYFWLLSWAVETLIIKLLLNVDSWFVSIFLAATVGSFVVWLIKHIPDLLE